MSKTVAAGNTNNRYYTYDESGHLLGEYLASGVRVQEYVWMDDTLVAVFSDHDATTYQYVQTDHLGTPRAVINPVSNAIIWRWNLTNTAFGEHAPTADPDGNTISYTFNLRYPGQWYDSESKLHYNYFRDYDPSAGRYLQSDPIGHAGGVDGRSYARSSTFRKLDKYGLVDLNYFPDNYFYWNDISDKADLRSTGPSVISVAAHASAFGPQDVDGNPIRVEDLAAAIMKTEKYREGVKFVELDACNLGARDYAQRLANIIRIPVVAPNQFVFFRSDGSVFLSEAKMDGYSLAPTEGRKGEWLMFSPGKSSPSKPVGWSP